MAKLDKMTQSSGSRSKAIQRYIRDAKNNPNLFIWWK